MESRKRMIKVTLNHYNNERGVVYKGIGEGLLINFC
jgi:hypothetical protein